MDSVKKVLLIVDGKISDLHRGQTARVLAQASMQVQWKMWPQLSMRTVDCLLKSSRQIAQLLDSSCLSSAHFLVGNWRSRVPGWRPTTCAFLFLIRIIRMTARGIVKHRRATVMMRPRTSQTELDVDSSFPVISKE